MGELIIKILFVRPFKSSFIQKDLDILQRHFKVKVIDFKHSSKKEIIKTMFLMIFGVLWADVTFSWFADNHAFLAVKLSKIFRKKSVVVIGGYDVVEMPEIQYGAVLNSKFLSNLRYTLKNADKILSFSKNGVLNALKHLNPSNLTPSNIEVVYLGIDKFNLTHSTYKYKEDLVLTVGYVKSSNLQRKGLKTFVEAAKYLPDTNFVLIGPHMDDSINYLKSIASANVKFTGYVSDAELLNYYTKAKVYVQVSAHEGFGVAMAEAMSFECVPVVTDRGAIKEVVGDTGFYVEYGNPEQTAKAVEKALNSNKGKNAKDRIGTKFAVELREVKIIGILNSLMVNQNVCYL